VSYLQRIEPNESLQVLSFVEQSSDPAFDCLDRLAQSFRAQQFPAGVQLWCAVFVILKCTNPKGWISLNKSKIWPTYIKFIYILFKQTPVLGRIYDENKFVTKLKYSLSLSFLFVILPVMAEQHCYTDLPNSQKG